MSSGVKYYNLLFDKTYKNKEGPKVERKTIRRDPSPERPKTLVASLEDSIKMHTEIGKEILLRRFNSVSHKPRSKRKMIDSNFNHKESTKLKQDKIQVDKDQKLDLFKHDKNKENSDDIRKKIKAHLKQFKGITQEKSLARGGLSSIGKEEEKSLSTYPHSLVKVAESMKTKVFDKNCKEKDSRKRRSKIEGKNKHFDYNISIEAMLIENSKIKSEQERENYFLSLWPKCTCKIKSFFRVREKKMADTNLELVESKSISLECYQVTLVDSFNGLNILFLKE